MVLLPGTNIVVDGFKYTSRLESPHYIFFLTHYHSDHYSGLSNTWSRGPIYCSQKTADLLKLEFFGLDCVIPLEFDEVHWIYLDNRRTKGVEVTLIDANHCPGSAMLLFKGEMGNYLHTGDFRFCPEMLEHPALLDSAKQIIPIDHLFLDNTFARPDYCFPPREECFRQIVSVIEKNSESNVWLSIDNFGREELLLELAKKFKTLAVVSPRMYSRIETLGLEPEYFSTNEDDGWIKAVSKAEMKEIPYKNTQQETIGIYLSGWNKKYFQQGKWIYVSSS